MKKLSSQGRRWLLAFHVFFASIWIGTALSMNLILLLKGSPLSEEKLHAFHLSVKLLDDFLIIPSAMGTMATGLLISIVTEWGFFKFSWVTIKWVVTIILLFSGSFWLFPWLNTMLSISTTPGLINFQESAYSYYRTMFLLLGNVQALILGFLVLISVIKPRFKTR